MECMLNSRMGQTSYLLKHIEANTGIPVQRLRKDIRSGILKIGGKTFNSYYILQSDLDEYLIKSKL